VHTPTPIAPDLRERFLWLLRRTGEPSRGAQSGSPVHPYRQINSDVQSKRGRLRSPLVVMLDLTTHCNQNCVFCYRSGPGGLSPAGRPRHQSLEAIRTLCREFAEVGVAGVTLTGGEPTCHPDFLEAVAEVKRHDLALTLMTNGVRWTRDQIERLQGLLQPERDRVELSLDAASARVYRDIRGADHLPAVLETLKGFARHRIPFITITLILEKNLHEIEAVLDLAERHGARECAVETPFPKRSVPEQIYAPIGAILALYAALDRRPPGRARLFLDFLHLALAAGLLPHLMSECARDGRPAAICHAGYSSCAVDIGGDVHVCQYVIDSGATRVGNAFQTPFPILWGRVQDRREALGALGNNPTCRECGLTETCRGVCPAIWVETLQGSAPAPPCAPGPAC
jgi:radical SAM protein with 4Fe4S-binding SPASM domain